jgi:hypothetical protein
MATRKSTLRRIWERLTGTTARGWLLVGALLGAGMLPCPECGAPMILHFWPIAGLVLVVQALKRRYRGASPAEDGEKEENSAPPVDHRRE